MWERVRTMHVLHFAFEFHCKCNEIFFIDRLNIGINLNGLRREHTWKCFDSFFSTALIFICLNKSLQMTNTLNGNLILMVNSNENIISIPIENKHIEAEHIYVCWWFSHLILVLIHTSLKCAKLGKLKFCLFRRSMLKVKFFVILCRSVYSDLFC